MPTRFTILLGFAIAACAAEAPANGNPPGDNNPPGENNPPGDNDPPPGGSGDGTTVAMVMDRISKTECDQAHTCKANFPTDAGVTFAELFGASPAECYPLNAMYWDATAVEAGITSGKITFDQAAADACMAGAITAPVCTTYWMEGPGVPDACFDAFAGTVASGGACASDFECSADLFCGDAGTCAMDTAP